MAGIRKMTISRRTVEALKTERDTTFWDRELPGFGVRVHPSGRKVYVAQPVSANGAVNFLSRIYNAAEDRGQLPEGEQPVPAGGQVLGAKAGAVPDRQGVPAAEVGSGRGGDPQGHLGHTQVETTARYAHLAQDSVRESAMRVLESIAADFLTDRSAAGAPAWRTTG